MPASLQASLLARLDRIPAAKELAQIGAVLGREFAHTLLTAIAGLPELTVLHGLQQLVNSGLAIRDGSPPEANYVFKHALVRDTAYGMLLRSVGGSCTPGRQTRSRNSHRSCGRQPELLAHHYTEAGLVEPAIAFWVKAARRSVARSAMIEAAAQLRQALGLVPSCLRVRHDFARSWSCRAHSAVSCSSCIRGRTVWPRRCTRGRWSSLNSWRT